MCFYQSRDGIYHTRTKMSNPSPQLVTVNCIRIKDRTVEAKKLSKDISVVFVHFQGRIRANFKNVYSSGPAHVCTARRSILSYHRGRERERGFCFFLFFPKTGRGFFSRTKCQFPPKDLLGNFPRLPPQRRFCSTAIYDYCLHWTFFRL